MSVVSTRAAGHGHGHAMQPMRNTRLSNGLIGIIFFLCSEVTLFGSLIFAYLFLRRSLGYWPPHGISRLEVALPAVNTVILITSSLWCHLAESAIARGNQSRFRFFLGLTILFGATFVTLQGIEYHSLRTAINHDIFGATFFTLTGLHGAHVSLGVLSWITVFILALRGRWTRDHHFAVNAVAIYWHFVDVVWVILFTLFYLV
jgi:cytochrome c oxidase subunit 3